MTEQLPDEILTAAVRFKFYTIIDWGRCQDLEASVLENELNAVINNLILINAPELSPCSAQQLRNQIIHEVQSLGYDNLAKLGLRLKPKVSLVSQFRVWFSDAAHRLVLYKHHQNQTGAQTS